MLHKVVVPATGLVKLIAAETRTLMDKCRSSRKQQHWPFRGHSLLVLLLISWTIALWPHLSNAITLSHADAQRIGKKIWQNECNGTISGLTAWNQGEDFASLGIGHFISKRGAKLPTLLLRGVEQSCPWNSRAEFSRAQHTVEMNQLRQFLVDTIDLQAEFLIARLEGALPKMLAE